MESRFGRRERQIMDVIYRLGKASVADVRAALPDPPTYSAVRGMLRLLEDKGYLQHRQDGLKYVYMPTVTPAKARVSALRHLVTTFFGGSSEDAVAALLELPDSKLSAQDRRRLAAMIKKAQQEGR
ncbi:MAG: BlaI/MecI/CopY family transcriptional regulator [Acidobacteriota bacterium]|nr:BlaI/MecI/CopY family transcriptional regulator [Acidobacteriota bacterium]